MAIAALARDDAASVVMGDIEQRQPHVTRERTNTGEIVQLLHRVGLWYLLASLGHVRLLVDLSVVPLGS
jgi:hypothetical protein